MGQNFNDISIDVVRAENWKREVEAELDSVDRLLKEVSKVCQTIPGEDDVFMNTLYDIGTELNEKWSLLGKGFKKTMEDLGSIIEKYKDSINKKLEELKEYKGKIGL